MPGFQTALLDLLHEVRGGGTDVAVIIGGGYGIYLKTEHVQRVGKRTLFQEWPDPRSTNDLDLFYLRPELLIDAGKLKPLAQALSRLGYRVVPPVREKYPVRLGRTGRRCGRQHQNRYSDRATCSIRRHKGEGLVRRRQAESVCRDSRPSGWTKPTTLEEGLLSETVTGTLSSGLPWRPRSFLPHPYTFVMMKLFAFRDRLADADKEYGRYHALDLYTILATTTESGVEGGPLERKRHAG
jgi:hypothetical protein